MENGKYIYMLVAYIKPRKNSKTYSEIVEGVYTSAAECCKEYARVHTWPGAAPLLDNMREHWNERFNEKPGRDYYGIQRWEVGKSCALPQRYPDEYEKALLRNKAE